MLLSVVVENPYRMSTESVRLSLRYLYAPRPLGWRMRENSTKATQLRKNNMGWSFGYIG
jgi:hypothetical protein